MNTLRNWRGTMTQPALASILGVSVRTLRRWELDEWPVPPMLCLLMTVVTPTDLATSPEIGDRPKFGNEDYAAFLALRLQHESGELQGAILAAIRDLGIGEKKSTVRNGLIYAMKALGFHIPKWRPESRAPTP